MYIKCVHFNGTLNGSLFSENEGDETQVRLCVSPQTRPSRAASQVLKVTNEAGDLRRKIAFLTEAQMAVIQAAESETSWPTRLSCPKSMSRPNGSVRSSFSRRTWQRSKVMVNWPYLDLQYFLSDFGYEANLHIRIMEGMFCRLPME